jgi:hypothetical protein
MISTDSLAVRSERTIRVETWQMRKTVRIWLFTAFFAVQETQLRYDKFATLPIVTAKFGYKVVASSNRRHFILQRSIISHRCLIALIGFQKSESVVLVPYMIYIHEIPSFLSVDDEFEKGSKGVS